MLLWYVVFREHSFYQITRVLRTLFVLLTIFKLYTRTHHKNQHRTLTLEHRYQSSARSESSTPSRDVFHNHHKESVHAVVRSILKPGQKICREITNGSRVQGVCVCTPTTIKSIMFGHVEILENICDDDFEVETRLLRVMRII